MIASSLRSAIDCIEDVEELIVAMATAKDRDAFLKSYTDAKETLEMAKGAIEMIAHKFVPRLGPSN